MVDIKFGKRYLFRRYCILGLLTSSSWLQWRLSAIFQTKRQWTTFLKYSEVVACERQTFLLAHRRWGTFGVKERLRLSDKNSILMTYINVYIIKPVVMGFHMQICSILLSSWSILEKRCVHLRMSSSKLKCFFKRRLYSTNIDCFVRDSSCLHLTFVAFCLSFVNNS